MQKKLNFERVMGKDDVVITKYELTTRTMRCKMIMDILQLICEA